MQTYRTILTEAVAEYEEKRSKFLAVVLPCDSDRQAAELLAERRSKFWDAKHHVYAYALKDGTVRFSDDGEPHGTAGKPVLDALRGSGLVNVMVIVTRYFGGTLLGTGGLVRAYSTAAQNALQATKPVFFCACIEYELCCDYGDLDYLLKWIPLHGGQILHTTYAENIVFQTLFKADEAEAFCLSLTNDFCGRIKPIEKAKKISPFFE